MPVPFAGPWPDRKLALIARQSVKEHALGRGCFHRDSSNRGDLALQRLVGLKCSASALLPATPKSVGFAGVLVRTPQSPGSGTELHTCRSLDQTCRKDHFCSGVDVRSVFRILCGAAGKSFRIFSFSRRPGKRRRFGFTTACR